VKFEVLAKTEMVRADESVDYILVYHSSDKWYPTTYKRGTIVKLSTTTDIYASPYTFTHVVEPDIIHTISGRSHSDRLIVTTKMKRRVRNNIGWRTLDEESVKCFYPLVADSPYYTDEDLFAAKISNDYDVVFKKLRKAFNDWKKIN